MSPVDIWCSPSMSFPGGVSSFELMFANTIKKKVLVVESQDEFDYCWAMQLVVGGEIKIIIREGGLEVRDYLKLFVVVYTTWDPADPNRI